MGAYCRELWGVPFEIWDVFCSPHAPEGEAAPLISSYQIQSIPLYDPLVSLGEYSYLDDGQNLLKCQ